MARTNLIPNPSAFASSLDGWTLTGGAQLSVEQTSAYFGRESFKVTNLDGVAGAGMKSSTPIAVTAGQTYSVSVYSYIPAYDLDVTQDTPLRLYIDWHDSANDLISTVQSDVVTVLVESTWAEKRLTLVGVAPAGATRAYVYVQQEAIGIPDQIFLLDGWLMEASSYIGEFFNNFTQSQENLLVNKALTAVPFPNITGMQLNADIAIADLVLNTIDEQGTVWVCTEIDGWWTSAQPEVPDITRGTEDGSYDISGRYAARQITLSGVFVPQDPSNIQVARDKLIRAVNLVRKSAWLRTDEQPTRASKVWLVGQPQIQTVNARGRTEFSIPLRAPDPIKYLWNDQSQDGTLTEIISANDSGSIENEGNTRVTAYLELTGPLGAGSTIESSNKFSDQLITTAFSLRGAGDICDIIEVSRADGIVTVVTEYISGAEVNDVLILSAVPSQFVPTDGLVTVTSVSNESPYAFTYDYAGPDSTGVGLNGATASLVTGDVLGIDNYNQTVVFNGDASGHRSKLEPLIDWLKFEEGLTNVDFRESIVPYKVRKKSYSTEEFATTVSVRVGDVVTITAPGHTFIVGDPVVITGTTNGSGAFNGSWEITSVVATSTFSFKHTTSGDVASASDTGGLATVSRATIVFDRAHKLGAGDFIDIALPEQQTIITKSLSSNVATLTTEEPHGYAVGDKVTVQVTTQSVVEEKKVVLDSPTSGVDTVTINTVGAHGISTNDVIRVELPLTATVTRKSASTSAVTLTTATAHGFSIGDTIVVTLPVTNFITKKKAVSDVVTLTTQNFHNFSVGDLVEIVLPASASVNKKTITPSSVILETTSDHGFSAGDLVSITLPVTATIDSYRFGGSTVSGEYYTVTITTASAHGFEVGDKISVDASGTGRDGTFYVESVPSPTTFTYFYYGSDTAIPEDGAETGTVTNLTNQTITGASGTATKTLTATTSTPNPPTMTYAR